MPDALYAALIVIGILAIVLWPKGKTSAEAVADFKALKREQERLAELEKRAVGERWPEKALASLRQDRQSVESRLAEYR